MCFLRRLGKKAKSGVSSFFLARRRRKQIGNFAPLGLYRILRLFCTTSQVPYVFSSTFGEKKRKVEYPRFSCSPSKKTNRELCFHCDSTVFREKTQFCTTSQVPHMFSSTFGKKKRKVEYPRLFLLDVEENK